jgi:3-hydroxyacyl-CoA dehydrogenase/enoyl-CoA hydratase/3-hydroxybutyryl-CoA epimerase/enoyl-CoA isomerase
LVEVIRGAKSSDETIATVVAYASAIGKSPIVVNDCPGFFVNRVLFPYFGGFSMLLRDGADFVAVDKVMESFGWPMGPAYLLDVVGMDTGHHANAVMAEGFPDRMSSDYKTANDVMYENKRYGQKTGSGFYKYEMDKKGRPLKLIDETTYKLLAPITAERKEFDKQDIVNRMMLPLIIETIRCIEDKIVDTVAEADMGLIYGLGFPPFRGGPLKYADSIGMDNLVKLADGYAHLGKMYEATEGMRKMAAAGDSYYPQEKNS